MVQSFPEFNALSTRYSSQTFKCDGKALLKEALASTTNFCTHNRIEITSVKTKSDKKNLFL